jgi:hypothetical protein
MDSVACDGQREHMSASFAFYIIKKSPSQVPTYFCLPGHSTAILFCNRHRYEGSTHHPSLLDECCKHRSGSERRSTASAHLRFASTRSPIKLAVLTIQAGTTRPSAKTTKPYPKHTRRLMLNSFLLLSSDQRQFSPRHLRMEPPAQLMRQH